jgi:hypothetical protein
MYTADRGLAAEPSSPSRVIDEAQNLDAEPSRRCLCR